MTEEPYSAQSSNTNYPRVMRTSSSSLSRYEIQGISVILYCAAYLSRWKHAEVYLEICIFQDTYHERSDHHIWHLRQLVVQQSRGRMIRHLYQTKGEYTLIDAVFQTKQC